MSKYVNEMLIKAKEASYRLAGLSSAEKNRAIKKMAVAILKESKYILAENKKDLNFAKKNGRAKSFIDRLRLTDKRLKEMSSSLKAVAKLPDPIGRVFWKNKRPNGMQVQKVRVPIGVILIVYEARPNVTGDCIGLLFKTSNVGILRGGRDAANSNKAIGKVLAKSLSGSRIKFSPFFIVENTDRKVVNELLKRDEYIDLVIPRGGESLIRKVVETSSIPVIKHFKGICHIFIDVSASIDKAVKICANAKVQRPSVCNAVETILVHRRIAKKFLPNLKKEFDKYNIQIRGDAKTCQIIPGIKKAVKKDWQTEYLDLIVSIRVVKDVDEAVNHINTFSSHHTESILTNNRKNAEKFVSGVDSGCCFINLSTRFSDGYQFGLGAEIGISTDKLHARGPMGLEELTTYKWIGRGTGQVRE